MNEPAPELQGADHLRSPEVQVPVLHPYVLAGEDTFLLIPYLKGRDARSPQKLGGCDEDLHAACGVPLILRSGHPAPHNPPDGDGGFAGEGPNRLCQIPCVRIFGKILGVEDRLSYTVSVRKVDESHSSVVPGESYPALKAHFRAYVGRSELSAGMGSYHLLHPLKVMNQQIKAYIKILTRRSPLSRARRERNRRGP
ncbi:hypothetical protein SDC9_119493 [bioreactor metagenome]|uniref:Uncharacterized protein n=1 Tax=bioreactor metagenome TaxID=1076179 RepID=A0A645C5Q3_9ZZZZ